MLGSILCKSTLVLVPDIIKITLDMTFAEAGKKVAGYVDEEELERLVQHHRGLMQNMVLP